MVIIIIIVGNVIHIMKGQWEGTMAGVGAGLDSFYEYLLKVSYEYCIHHLVVML